MVDVADDFNRANGTLGPNWQASTFAPATQPGNNLYVSLSGSDSNNGSIGAPFRTITRSTQVATPGTVVHVAPGVYQETVSVGTSGTPGQPIRYQSDVLHGAIVRPTSSGAIWQVSADWIEVDGFDIDGSLNGNIRVGIMQYGANDIISRCLVHHIILNGATDSNGGAAILCNGGFYNKAPAHVVGCYVHSIATPSSSRCHGIYTQQPGGSVLNNIVRDVNGIGITGWHDASNILYANNTVIRTVGIHVGGGDFYFLSLAVNQKIVNNIVRDCSWGINQNGFIDPTGWLVDSNLVFGNGIDYGNNGTFFTQPTNSIAANPNFVNYSANDFHLAATSPAINSGNATYAPTTDYDGNPRSAPDRGAYEFI